MGCASIKSTKINDDKFIGYEKIVSPPVSEDILCNFDYKLHQLKELIVSADCWLICNEDKYKIYDRNMINKKEFENPNIPYYEFVSSIILTGLGIGVIIDAPNVPEKDTITKSNPVGRKGAYTIGIISTGIGGALLVSGVVDAFRSKDTTENVGKVKELDSSSPISCYEKDWKRINNVLLEVVYPDGQRDKSEVSHEGITSFKLPEEQKLFSYTGDPVLHIYYKGNVVKYINLVEIEDFRKGRASYYSLQASEAYKSGDFEDAIYKIGLSIKDNPYSKEYEDFKNKITKEYCSNLFSEAKRNLNENKFIEAMSKIQKTLNYEPNNEDYLKLYDEIQASIEINDIKNCLSDKESKDYEGWSDCIKKPYKIDSKNNNYAKYLDSLIKDISKRVDKCLSNIERVYTCDKLVSNLMEKWPDNKLIKNLKKKTDNKVKEYERIEENKEKEEKRRNKIMSVDIWPKSGPSIAFTAGITYYKHIEFSGKTPLNKLCDDLCNDYSYDIFLAGIFCNDINCKSCIITGEVTTYTLNSLNTFRCIVKKQY
jgi:tetratricopeptide (TPR) repeat protein